MPELGFVPEGLASLGSAWTAAIPDYAPAFIKNPMLGYLFAAIVGAVLVVGVTWGIGRLLSRDDRTASADILGAARVIPALAHIGDGLAAPPASPALAGAPHGARGAASGHRGARQRRDRVAPGAHAAARPARQAADDPALRGDRELRALAGGAARPRRADRGARGRVAAERRLVLSQGVGIGRILRAIALAARGDGLDHPGEVLVPLGPLSITEPGLYIAARLITRVAAGAGIGLLVVWTTRWTDLLHALTALRMPDLIVATLAMTQRQIVTLLRTVENTHLARESRMLSAGSAKDNRGWVTERMAFVARKSMKTADDVYDAMLARGFSGAMPSLVRLRTSARDWAWVAGSIVACAVLLGVDRAVMPR